MTASSPGSWSADAGRRGRRERNELKNGGTEGRRHDATMWVRRCRRARAAGDRLIPPDHKSRCADCVTCDPGVSADRTARPMAGPASAAASRKFRAPLRPSVSPFLKAFSVPSVTSVSSIPVPSLTKFWPTADCRVLPATRYPQVIALKALTTLKLGRDSGSLIALREHRLPK